MHLIDPTNGSEQPWQTQQSANENAGSQIVIPPELLKFLDRESQIKDGQVAGPKFRPASHEIALHFQHSPIIARCLLGRARQGGGKALDRE